MKKPTTRSVGRLESIRTADQRLSIPVVVSFLGHMVFCLLFILLPKMTSERSTPSRIINVELVSASMPLPESAPAVRQATLPDAAPAAVPESATTAPVADAAVSTASKPKEAVSLAPAEIEKKQSMKKKTYQRERVLESAIKKVEKQVEQREEESKVDPKQQALARIRSELEEKEAKAATEGSETTADTGGLTGEGEATSDIQRIYYAVVQVSIQNNWAFSDQLAGEEKNLYNMVVIKILRDGTIEDIWFDRRSGNNYFDDSTYKAILKSSPLPPIPDGISGPSLTLGFRFIPEGLK